MFCAGMRYHQQLAPRRRLAPQDSNPLLRGTCGILKVTQVVGHDVLHATALLGRGVLAENFVLPARPVECWRESAARRAARHTAYPNRVLIMIHSRIIAFYSVAY